MLQEARLYANNWHVKYYFHDEHAAHPLFMACGRHSGLVLSTTGTRRWGGMAGATAGVGR